MYILEPEKQIPVLAEADLCVIGGSCTGVFAAIRAARLGLKVILLEKHNILGGTAVTGLVNIWHSLLDDDRKYPVIAGLTRETLDRLASQNALEMQADAHCFNPWHLALILDRYVRENAIQVMLHTAYTSVLSQSRQLHAVVIENTEGRFAISAKFFIDASGDGRVARDLGIPAYTSRSTQPPSSCFFLQGSTDGIDLGKLVREHGREFGLEDDWGWYTHLAGTKDIQMRADNHVFGLQLHHAEDLTKAEMEGRRQAYALTRLLNQYGGLKEPCRIVGMCSHIGVRETLHYRTRFQADEHALLTGQRYEAPILNGTYRVDIHHSTDKGITFRYLNGKEVIHYGKNTKNVVTNWRQREHVTGDPAKYYQLPFDILVVNEYDNFIPVGRMLHADAGSFGALRVMVNLNQLGEAAGVAAYLCVNSGKSLQSIRPTDVTTLLKTGGSAL